MGVRGQLGWLPVWDHALSADLAWCHESDAHLDALREAVLDTRRHGRPRLLLRSHCVRLVGLRVVLEACLEQDARTVIRARRRRVLLHRRACHIDVTHYRQ